MDKKSCGLVSFDYIITLNRSGVDDVGGKEIHKSDLKNSSFYVKKYIVWTLDPVWLQRQNDTLILKPR